jgi:cell division protein FtsQ
MWDDAQALRRLGNALFGISLLLMLSGMVHYAIHLPMFAIKAVQLQSAPQHADAAQIEAVVRNDLRGNFFTVDLARLRQALEQLPWVRKATVQRQFPWQLDVALEEDEALASWNGAGLVNVQGEVFDAGNAKTETNDKTLPAFSGPEGSAAVVTWNFERFSSALAPIGQAISQISLSPRQSWQLRLRSGLVLELGREQTEQRLARFIAAYPGSVGNMQPPVKYVDLRYRNGFAARLAG